MYVWDHLSYREIWLFRFSTQSDLSCLILDSHDLPFFNGLQYANLPLEGWDSTEVFLLRLDSSVLLCEMFMTWAVFGNILFGLFFSLLAEILLTFFVGQLCQTQFNFADCTLTKPIISYCLAGAVCKWASWTEPNFWSAPASWLYMLLFLKKFHINR